MDNAAKRRAAIAEIIELGGTISYYDASKPNSYGEPPAWYSWLRKLHGDEHLGNAIIVSFGGLQITDAGLVHLEGLTKLEELDLHGTQITDAGLVHLKDLTKLKSLDLNFTQISDAGLVHLEGLTKLEELDLHGTQITDGGLVHLKGLTNFGYLLLSHPHVTDEGVKNFRKALPKCAIFRLSLPLPK